MWGVCGVCIGVGRCERGRMVCLKVWSVCSVCIGVGRCERGRIVRRRHIHSKSEIEINGQLQNSTGG